MRTLLKLGLPPIVALVLGLHVSAGDARAQYRAAPAYWSILTTPVNYRPVNNTLVLGWNNTTAQLPYAKPYGVGVKLGIGKFAGECAYFGQLICPNVPGTSNWVRGQQVAAGGVQPGTLIATFQTWNGQRWTYNGHAAIFVGYGPGNSLIVVDQNWVPNVAAYHTIPCNGKGGVTDGFGYYVVR